MDLPPGEVRVKFLKAKNVISNINQRGNYNDNAVAESFSRL